MMKGFGLWIMFLMFGASLICLCCSSFPGYEDARMKVKVHNEDARMKVKVHNCRKLKKSMNVDHYEGDASHITLLDYHQTDPVPSSKTSIRHGPIQHDVPLMPYIPKPPSPGPGR